MNHPYNEMRKADKALTKAIQQGASEDRIKYLRERLEDCRRIWIEWERGD